MQVLICISVVNKAQLNSGVAAAARESLPYYSTNHTKQYTSNNRRITKPSKLLVLGLNFPIQDFLACSLFQRVLDAYCLVWLNYYH